MKTKLSSNSARRRNRGFTLVELTISLAVAGLLAAAVVGGQELIDSAKADKMLNDLKNVEGLLQHHAQLKGRLPGDCNRDGVFDASLTEIYGTINTSYYGTPATVQYYSTPTTYAGSDVVTYALATFGTSTTATENGNTRASGDDGNVSRANAYSQQTRQSLIAAENTAIAEDQEGCTNFGASTTLVRAGRVRGTQLTASQLLSNGTPINNSAAAFSLGSAGTAPTYNLGVYSGGTSGVVGGIGTTGTGGTYSSTVVTQPVGSDGVNFGAMDITDPAVNVWINDLKIAGLVSDTIPNRRFAKHVGEDFTVVGNISDPKTGAKYNAVVMFGVPQWMARKIAVGINGFDSDGSDRGRLRRLTPDMAGYETLWQKSNEMRNTMVNIVYFYDRVPTTSGVASPS